VGFGDGSPLISEMGRFIFLPGNDTVVYASTRIPPAPTFDGRMWGWGSPSVGIDLKELGVRRRNV